MADITEELRAAKWSTGAPFHPLMPDAALEIERLREKLGEVERYARTLEQTISNQAAEVERLRKATSFGAADWYWSTYDPDDSGDTANGILWDHVGALEIMEVAGAIEVGRRWGFFTINEEDDEPVYHWFMTEAEAKAAYGALKPQADLPLGDTEPR